jgi:hypothetical protein
LHCVVGYKAGVFEQAFTRKQDNRTPALASAGGRSMEIQQQSNFSNISTGVLLRFPRNDPLPLLLLPSPLGKQPPPTVTRLHSLKTRSSKINDCRPVHEPFVLGTQGHCIGAPGLNPPCPRWLNRTTIIPTKATSSNVMSAIVPALAMLKDVLEDRCWREMGEVVRY